MAEFQIRIESVDAFAVLGKQIPLNKLVAKVDKAEYEPEQFPGLVYQISEPRSAAIIFSSGKIVCTGAKSIEQAKEAVKKVVDKLRKVGITLPTTYDIQIDNIIAAAKIEAKLNLQELSFLLEGAKYDPNNLPGLVYSMQEPHVTFLIRGSGRIVCTGARNTKDIHTALFKLRKVLEKTGLKVKPAGD
jgi:transcription initiation factor TFIID TATA-box-binding protein